MPSSAFPSSAAPLVSVVPLLVTVGLFALALGAFGVRTLVHGRPRTERVIRQGGSLLLGEWFMEAGLWIVRPITSTCVRLDVHPDLISWTSLVLHLGAAFAIAMGAFGLGGWVLALGATCDALDGAVARARGVASDAGEVLDAAVDRWAEMAVFLAYAWYYRSFALGFVLAAAALMGAVMVSYARAKGEAFGIQAKGGLMQRHERAVYLCAATIFSPLVVWLRRVPAAHPDHVLVLLALAIVAVLANRTAFRRIGFVRAELRKAGR